MDKSWMTKSRLSAEYEKGVDNFLQFVKGKFREHESIPCPCKKCGNLNKLEEKEIKAHLFFHGIDQSYIRWIWHGERAPSRTPASVHRDESMQYDGETPYDVAETVNLVQAGHERYTGDLEKVKKILLDADKPALNGCSKFTKLSAIVELFNLKAKGGWSDISFNRLLEFLRQLLSDKDSLLPKNLCEIKKILSVYGIEYEKIHACPNDCILYRKEFKDETTCPTCGKSRYKVKKNKTRKGVPAKVLWYFPPIPRFKKMFQSVETAKNLTWHANNRSIDGKLRHPVDSPAWQLVDGMWPDFAAEVRNLRLALSSDGVNPYGDLSSKYSCWPVMLITYNLPPELCMKRKFIMLTMLISGPKQPGNDIDIYLSPLIDDLKILWHTGVEAFDAYRQQTFTLKAVLLWTISDFPAYGNLSGRIVKGYFGCPICGEEMKSIRLKYSKKNVYMHHRMHLAIEHHYRNQKKAFNGEQEFRLAPTPLTGVEVLSKVEGINTSWGKTNDPKNHTKCWKKKSIFFELEYWKYLPVRHNLDVMHIEKNVCENIIHTLLNIPGKTNDNLKSRRDLKHLGLRTELAPVEGEKRTYLPPASHTLSKKEKRVICETLYELDVPDGYSSNFKAIVSVPNLKLSGLKSHDCHILMQQLLPVALRSVLPKHVRYAIIRLCFFFNAICAKVIDVHKLREIQKDLVITLCMLEKYFPPSFFDITVHLTVHLVREVQLCGPVFLRWMYGFERYMSVLKGNVRNRNRPEGCMAECHMAEEAIEFCSEFLSDVEPIGIPPIRNTSQNEILYGKTPPGGHLVEVDTKSLEQAQRYVLQNTQDVEPYIEEHKNYLRQNNPRKSKNQRWIENEHNRTFSNWVKDRVLEERRNNIGTVSDILRWISQGPHTHVLKYHTYVINGCRFATKDRDSSRVNANSGVSILATAMQVASARDKNPVFSETSYYGVIKEIWLLDYSTFKIAVFKCDWVDNKNGTTVDELGFTLVDLDKTGYKSDSFILASQAKKVFYVLDQVDKKWSVVLEPPKRRYTDNDNEYDVIGDEFGDDVGSDVLPNVDSFDENDDSPSLYMRHDHSEGTWEKMKPPKR